MLDAILVGSRFLQFAGALVLLGSSLFYMYGREALVSPLPALKRRQWPRQVLVISALTAAVGTLLWVGRGKITAERFGEILESRDRSQAGPSAAARGLCLRHVDYGDERRASESEREEDE